MVIAEAIDDRTALYAEPRAPISMACAADRCGCLVGPAFTLCIVSPYPGGATDEFLNGQVLAGFDTEIEATSTCRHYARNPAIMPRNAIVDGTLLVVNNRQGQEVFRQPLLKLNHRV